MAIEKLCFHPFVIARKQILTIVIPAVPVIFLLIAVAFANNAAAPESILNISDRYFGGQIYLSANDLTQFDKIGGDGLIPIIRLGGITKETNMREFLSELPLVSLKGLKFLIIFCTIFLGYVAYAVVSRIVYEFKQGAEKASGIWGINLATIGLSLAAAFVVTLISSFSLQGFQLILLLNFGIFFTLSIPLAAAGEAMGESLYQAFNFIRYDLATLVQIYLLGMGVAIAAPIGLLILFMFPLSVLDSSVTVFAKLVLALFGVIFALYYQFVICSRSVYDFTRRSEVRVSAFRKIGRRVG